MTSPSIYLHSADAASPPAGGATDYQTFTLGTSAEVPSAVATPPSGTVRLMIVRFTGLDVDGEGANATCYLSDDADGELGLSPFATSGATQPISVRTAGSGDGFVSFALSMPFLKDAALFLHVKLSAGTYTTAQPIVLTEV